MGHLFWKGNAVDKDRILILGESHYGDASTCVGKYTPEDYSIGVMKSFIEADERSSWHLFFERVADSFGYSEKEQAVDFFDKICYGNYVTRFCDENNSKVVEEDIAANKVEYNNRLFEFVNANSIDAIVCFSKLVYWSLPKGNEKDESFEEIIISPPGVRKRIIEKYCYAPGVDHGCCDVILNKPLMVYGVNHPTGSHGYSHYEVFEVVKNEEILKNIIFVNEGEPMVDFGDLEERWMDMLQQKESYMLGEEPVNFELFRALVSETFKAIRYIHTTMNNGTSGLKAQELASYYQMLVCMGYYSAPTYTDDSYEHAFAITRLLTFDLADIAVNYSMYVEEEEDLENGIIMSMEGQDFGIEGPIIYDINTGDLSGYEFFANEVGY